MRNPVYFTEIINPMSLFRNRFQWLKNEKCIIKNPFFNIFSLLFKIKILLNQGLFLHQDLVGFFIFEFFQVLSKAKFYKAESIFCCVCKTN